MKNVIVVTGAGSGMGYETARIMGVGNTVLICGRTLSKIEKAVAALKQDGIDAHGMACDVSSLDAVKALADQAASLGKVRAVVNAAGVSPTGNDARTVFGTNMMGAIYVTDTFHALLGQDGVLINIASTAGHMIAYERAQPLCEQTGAPDLLEKALAISDHPGYAYSASKKVVIEYSKKCCVKFAKNGARIVSVSPGTFETPLLESVKESESTKKILAQTPVGRAGDPVEIAFLCQFLASDKARFITGVDIVIDGGYLTTLG